MSYTRFNTIRSIAVCGYYRYFRFCIKRILENLMQAKFEYGLERLLGSGKKSSGVNKGDAKSGSAEMSQSSSSVEDVLQEKKDVAKEHLVTNNRNWGKMSPMMLAAKTQDRDIIAHDLCWRVICKVWRNGTLRQQADIYRCSCSGVMFTILPVLRKKN